MPIEKLPREARERAWAEVTARASSFLGYVENTDRELPVLRLTPVA
jgi:hypothetical protein